MQLDVLHQISKSQMDKDMHACWPPKKLPVVLRTVLCNVRLGGRGWITPQTNQRTTNFVPSFMTEKSDREKEKALAD